MIHKLVTNYDKIIYCDVDTVIIKDLSPLFNLGINNYCIAGVKENRDSAYCKMLKIKNNTYFNAGVLLMNLKKIREIPNISEKLIELSELDFNKKKNF